MAGRNDAPAKCELRNVIRCLQAEGWFVENDQCNYLLSDFKTTMDHSDLVMRSRLLGQKAPGSKPDSSDYTPCMWPVYPETAEIIPTEQYSTVLGELSYKIPAEDESDALTLDGEVTENSDQEPDSEIDVEDNPVHQEYSD
ncbi:hypothetical protein AVEN_160751-1 [Araneus ventricosus]|uniref:Uncharacterized protein n=1 Tax=Araneus ventricosus TaxID=182803 RepID=A0A4Y2G9N6_ARAVE|nr:hypothetical protein AVEN_160751-1 [Araneus ventricosus]